MIGNIKNNNFFELNEEIETAIINKLLNDNDEFYNCYYIFSKVNEKYFFIKKNKIIFKIIKNLFIQKKIFDLRTILNELEKKNLLNIIQPNDIQNIFNSYINDSLLNEYIEILKENYIKNLLKKLNSNLDFSIKQEESSNKIITKVYNDLDNITDENLSKKDYLYLSETIEDTIKQLENWENNEIHITGLTSGYEELDDITSGFNPGELIILAARPSMGKTTLSINFLLNAIKDKLDKVVVFVSLETSHNVINQKILQITSFVEVSKIKFGKKLNTEEWKTVKCASEKLKKSKIIIIDEPNITFSKLSLILNKIHSKYKDNLSLIVIDYLQLINYSEKVITDRNKETSIISRKLKILARNLSTPIITISQLSRYVERRENKRPIMSDLRDSGSIEQDADIVLFLYRENYYNKIKQEVKNNLEEQEVKEIEEKNFNEDEKKNFSVSELIIAKNRNGKIANINFMFDQKRGIFFDNVWYQKNKHNKEIKDNLLNYWTKKI